MPEIHKYPTLSQILVRGNSANNTEIIDVAEPTTTDSATTKNYVDTAVSTKEGTITAGTTAQYFRGDKTFVTLNTTIVPEGTNLYYTDVRADARITAQKGAANGLAPLDATSKIDASYLPSMSITNTYVVASQVAMLALTAQTGDVAVRTDLNKSYILAGTDATVLADWQELLTPTDAVLSVNGLTGSVTLSTTNIGEGTNLYYTATRFNTAFSGKSTTDLAEGTNLYYTNARGIASTLTGYTSGAGTISSADTILQAIQKLDANDATNANLTGVVTSVGNATSIANGAITNAMLANGAVANLSGTNTGDQTNITGNAATVTTNANLTGPITSVGNTTSVASQTGTGSTFAMSAGPTFSGTTSFSGSISMSAAIGIISSDTSDGSDTKGVLLNGGGGTTYNTTRGAYIYLLGNEYSGAGGAIAIVAGDSSSNGAIGLYTGDGAGTPVNRLNVARSTGVVSIYNSLGVNTTSPIGRLQVTTGDTGTVTDYAFIKTSGAVANQGGVLIGNAANGTSAYRALKITATYAGTPASTSATLGFVDEAATETFLSNANGHMNFYHNSGAGYVNFNTLVTFQSSISSIFNQVITTSNATLTTLTQGLSIAGNLVSTPYVSDGFASGVTWSSTTDNAAKPKAGLFCKTTGAGTYVYIGTSDDYATGITHLGFAVDPRGKTYCGATTAAAASLNIGSGTAPTTPEAGDLYRVGGYLIDYDGATAKYFVQAGNSTKTTAGAPYTNDGYITLTIGGAQVKVMTTA